MKIRSMKEYGSKNLVGSNESINSPNPNILIMGNPWEHIGKTNLEDRFLEATDYTPPFLGRT